MTFALNADHLAQVERLRSVNMCNDIDFTWYDGDKCNNCREHIGFNRYEKLRRLNAHQFAELFKAHLSSGKTFDEMVDEL